ncbi:MAG: DUF1636 domain-containing protein [Pseudomonadota bacterium]
MKPCIYICETCRFSKEQDLDEDGRKGGQVLYEKIQALSANGAISGEHEIRTIRCLMGCDNHCNIHLRAPGKMAYVMGRFEPTEESAEAIGEYFEKYIQSETGQVPYKTWPQGVKGHFIARVPPLDE